MDASHTLRHRGGAAAYAGNEDLHAVQELLGHACPDTTAIYTYVPAATIRAAMTACRRGLTGRGRRQGAMACSLGSWASSRPSA